MINMTKLIIVMMERLDEMWLDLIWRRSGGKAGCSGVFKVLHNF